MPTIHVARDGAKLGEFTLDQIHEGLRTGQFRPTDLGWESGMPDWRPLATFVVEKPAVAMPSGEAIPGAPIVSALPAASVTPGVGLPWEHRQQLGFFKAFFDTVLMVLTKPAEAFKTMRPGGGLTDPILFVLIGGSIGIIISFLFQLLISSMGVMGDRNSGLAGMFGIGYAIAYLVLVPILLIVGMFVSSGICHLFLMMVGGANKPFETTFRVVCFGSGATYLIALIPFCGSYISGIYNIVVQIIGLASAHETATSKAAMSVLLPLVLCCGLILVVVFILVGASGADLKSLFH
jgi:hypothetical protein